jgi:pyridoxine 5-phosphate synthase
MRKIRLGVNIDHVCTVRNARGGIHPDPIRAAKVAEAAGADGITAHLREDRRHITDADLYKLKREIQLPLNMEMAVTEEMFNIAVKIKPNAVCLVPEKRDEVTTEGGLDVRGNFLKIKDFVSNLKQYNLRISIFVDPDESQIQACNDVGADIVEIHTGSYCNSLKHKNIELEKIINSAKLAGALNLECHAGHGLNYDTVTPIAKINNIVELNIGHFLMGEAIFLGLDNAIIKMKKIINEGIK